MDKLFIIGVFLAFFMQFLLLAKKHKTLSDKILAVWMFIIGIQLFVYYLGYMDYNETMPFLISISHTIPLIHGPMLFLYTVFSLRTSQRIGWKDYLHLSPTVVSCIYLSSFSFFFSAEGKPTVAPARINELEVFLNLFLFLFFISSSVYPILSYRLLNKHRRLINQNFSYKEKINLNWLKYCIWGIGLIYLAAIITLVLRNTLGERFSLNAGMMVIYAIVSLFVIFLGYFGIRHKGIFVDGVAEGNTIVEPRSAGEYKKTGLKQADAELFHKKLTMIMKEQKPFLEPKLTLHALASELDIPIHHLSQIINQFEQKNFYDFINEYRVEEFKERVSDPKNSSFSFLAIAYDSGFNSKSSFNHVFKKLSGKTPSQFMAEVKAPTH